MPSQVPQRDLVSGEGIYGGGGTICGPHPAGLILIARPQNRELRTVGCVAELSQSCDEAA